MSASNSPNINPNIVKTTKKERRKKFSKFKDVAHKNFGKPMVTGVCLKKCKNRDVKCKECFKFNQLEEIKNGI